MKILKIGLVFKCISFKHREYLLIPARDHISQDLLQFAVQCNDFIHNARLNRGKVLIHW